MEHTQIICSVTIITTHWIHTDLQEVKPSGWRHVDLLLSGDFSVSVSPFLYIYDYISIHLSSYISDYISL